MIVQPQLLVEVDLVLESCIHNMYVLGVVHIPRQHALDKAIGQVKKGFEIVLEARLHVAKTAHRAKH